MHSPAALSHRLMRARDGATAPLEDPMNNAFFRIHHIILEVASYLLLIISVLLALAGMRVIKGPIPIHYDITGTPDSFGNATSLLLMPIIMLACNALCSVILHFVSPTHWNMPAKITPGHEYAAYGAAITLVTLVMLILAAFTVLFVICQILGATGPLILKLTLGMVVVMFLVIFIYWRKIKRIS